MNEMINLVPIKFLILDKISSVLFGLIVRKMTSEISHNSSKEI